MNSHGMLADRDLLPACTPYSSLRALFFTASLVTWFSRVNLKTRCCVCEVQRTLWSLVNQASREITTIRTSFGLFHWLQTLKGILLTCGNGSHQRWKKQIYRIVPWAYQCHHTVGLWLNVGRVSYEVLHNKMPRNTIIQKYHNSDMEGVTLQQTFQNVLSYGLYTCGSSGSCNSD